MFLLSNRFKKISKFSTIFAVLALMLLSFQNCGSSFHSSQGLSQLNNVAAGTQTSAPVIRILNAPSGMTNSPTAQISFAVETDSTTAVKSVLCSLNNQTPVNCIQGYSTQNLSDGNQSVRIIAVDSKDISSEEVVVAWQVDNTRPIAVFGLRPTATTTESSARFEFNATDNLSGVARLECSIDSSTFSTCTSPLNLSNLTNGNHTVSVRAIDRVNNPSLTISHTWRVDPSTTTPPPQPPTNPPLAGGIDTVQLANIRSFIPEDFTLFWAHPARAHPEVPLDFQFIAYEISKQPLTFSLVSGPSGMSLSSSGLLSWTATNAQVGSHSYTIRVSRQSGSSIQRTFSVSVNTTDFIFVSPTGSNTNNGSRNQPLQTLDAAMRRVSNADGKTIYVRAGTYTERYRWEVDGVNSPWTGQRFTENDPMILQSYPGENFTLNCSAGGHGVWAYSTSHVIFRNFRVTGATGRGAIMSNSSQNVVMQSLEALNSNYESGNNVTGILVQDGSGVVIDRVTARDNYDRNNSSHSNNSNFLFYTEGNTSGYFYVLRSFSSGSGVGYKIKHTGNYTNVIIHDSVSDNDHIGFRGNDDYSSLRYSKIINSQDTGAALFDGQIEATNYQGIFLIEHNTFVNTARTNVLVHRTWGERAIILKNIFQNTSGSTTFIETHSIANRSQLNFNKNVFFTTNLTANSTSIFRVSESNGSSSTMNFSSWKNLGYDGASVYANPGFTSVNYDIPANSSAVLSNSEFAGAMLPSP